MPNIEKECVNCMDNSMNEACVLYFVGGMTYHASALVPDFHLQAKQNLNNQRNDGMPYYFISLHSTPFW